MQWEEMSKGKMSNLVCFQQVGGGRISLGPQDVKRKSLTRSSSDTFLPGHMPVCSEGTQWGLLPPKCAQNYKWMADFTSHFQISPGYTGNKVHATHLFPIFEM